MKRQREEEKHNLTELSQWSRDALKSNTERLEQAERILKLAELTHKLETERENVVPFYKSSLSQEEVDQVFALFSFSLLLFFYNRLSTVLFHSSLK